MRMVIAAIGAAALTGCVAPSIPEVAPAASVPLAPEYFAQSRPPSGLDDVWWRGFQSEELDALVDQALERNQSLEAARQRLLAARAIVAAQRSDFLPDVSASASLDGSIDDAGTTSDAASAGLFGIWQLDLNGRLSAERAAAVAGLDAASYFVADQRRVIAAGVVSQYVELKRTSARLVLLDQSAELQRQTLDIVTLRFEAGLSSNLDVRRAAADLARTQAQRGPLILARTRAANALSVLAGEPPAPLGSAIGEASVPTFARGPDTGVPADLVRRRPDLLIAEADVMRAAANVGIERADMAPSFVLQGAITAGDGGVSRLLSSALATLGGILDLPIIDGGRRRAEVEAAERELDASVADYRQVLLQSLSEAESAFVAIEAAQDRLVELNKAVTQSEAAFEQSNALYREGLATLFDVLDVQRQLISSREAVLDARSDLAQAYVGLFVAVGAPTTAAET
ncbi:efflux transporter outer membrane subunit [Erythrobacter sp. SCSIO 43205]|uniref:efflux transporter outer membrane subunit n=1 Tax=Erythrobacter sp. SCSIO 43205 TaxID=2779361 RepID=UPI001CA91103|nr:efflux transporter outer membrane subunit [Erythrobacter sp. SCSIO 43205]UAB78863.1 efflux transporter outer membrane subunit [Erythrobacter sp. SCSIO 43205]